MGGGARAVFLAAAGVVVAAVLLFVAWRLDSGDDNRANASLPRTNLGDHMFTLTLRRGGVYIDGDLVVALDGWKYQKGERGRLGEQWPLSPLSEYLSRYVSYDAPRLSARRERGSAPRFSRPPAERWMARLDFDGDAPYRLAQDVLRSIAHGSSVSAVVAMRGGDRDVVLPILLPYQGSADLKDTVPRELLCNIPHVDVSREAITIAGFEWVRNGRRGDTQGTQMLWTGERRPERCRTLEGPITTVEPQQLVYAIDDARNLRDSPACPLATIGATDELPWSDFVAAMEIVYFRAGFEVLPVGYGSAEDECSGKAEEREREYGQ